ncbi:MAG: alpha/beta family hydrolase [Thiogranum sp.]|nr:alpha/beta family hydrolase [Thiogranum sp.]
MGNEYQPDEIEIPAGKAILQGDLVIPAAATGIVVFAHGSGSSRFSPRNRWMARQLSQSGLATLLFDLLTAEEQVIDEQTRELRFDIPLLSDRLGEAVDWVSGQTTTRHLAIGLFGASTGAAAALNAAADRPQVVRAVVSRGGRPDLAMNNLPRVQAPTLLIVGGLDHAVIEMNREAAAQLYGECRLEIVPGATHLFEEPGKLEEVAELARNWFGRYLGEQAA